MEFQLSYFKSWKMMLWKCCTQYASTFGKLSSGHRTGKGQFSFQSQRKAMPKNVQVKVKSLDCSLPCSLTLGIFQEIVLKWVAISFSRNSSWTISNPKTWCCESVVLNMPANLENSAVATGLEKVSFHSNPKEGQYQRMFGLPHNCTHLTH